jgi:hypothetical protein
MEKKELKVSLLASLAFGAIAEAAHIAEASQIENAGKNDTGTELPHPMRHITTRMGSVVAPTSETSSLPGILSCPKGGPKLQKNLSLA